jgi:hypothetical protein
MMSDRVEALSNDDLQAIANAKQKAIMAAQQAERFVAEAKVAELEHRTTVQHIFLKNSLNIDCRIDESTGYVTWPEDFSGEDQDQEDQDQEG